MANTEREEIIAQARKLLEKGWHVNLVPGSITRRSTQRTGLVDEAVWQAMKDIQAGDPAWTATTPQPLSPPLGSG
jgi:hypothetical protein